jgi:anthranilate phosphoribosyltransferase
MKNMVILNASAGLVVGRKADNLKEGAEIATNSIDSGSAYKKLKALIKSSGSDLAKIEEIERKNA